MNAVRLERLPGGIAWVTLDRPQAANAVSRAVAVALEGIVREIEDDPALRVAVITGAGERVFCAGADLKDVAAYGIDSLRTRAGGFAGFVHAPRTRPWIAAVNGVALGGGFEIVLACDMVVAAPHARFALPEVQRGLIAGAGGLFRLPRALPRNLALELITTGRSLSAIEGHRFGVVNRLAGVGEPVRDLALALAAELLAAAPVALRESLRVARAAAGSAEAELWLLNEECRERVRATADAIEGARAFAEKRTPQWSGRP